MCSVDACPHSVRAKGLCAGHYSRLMRTGEIGGLLRSISSRAGGCTVEGCATTKVYARGWCHLHYHRNLRDGDPGFADRKYVARGGVYIDPRTGYIYEIDPTRGRQVLQHRLVIERDLGRRMERWENVHHRNGQRDDNRLDNLEIWVTPQPAGQRPLDLLAWCDENRDLLEQGAAWNAARVAA